MRGKFNFLFILTITLLLSGNILAQTSETAKTKKAASNSATSVALKAQTKCPVLDGPIDKKVFVDYKGKRIYFCCAGCEQDFNKDPEKYLKKMETDGIKLEDTPPVKK